MNERRECLLNKCKSAFIDLSKGEREHFVIMAAAMAGVEIKSSKAPEEKEALDAIEQVEWDGEGLPPVGTIYTTEPHFEIELLCKYSSEYVVVGEMLPRKTYKGMEVVIDTMNQRDRTFRKPETPEAKKEREELEAAYDLYCDWAFGKSGKSFEQFKDADGTKSMWLRVVRKTGYRKGE